MLILTSVVKSAAWLLRQVLVVGPRYGSWGTERYGVAPRQVRSFSAKMCFVFFLALLAWKASHNAVYVK